MYQRLQNYILHHSTITSDVFSNSSKFFKPITVAKGKQLLMGGEVCQYLYFINRGCLRTYYITEQGLERSRFIAFEGVMVTALASFMAKEPSFEYLDVLEDSELLAIGYDDFYGLVESVAGWKDFYLQLLSHAYIYQNKKIETLVTLDAKQRYEALIMQNPNFVLRLPNRILATFLDVSQETLSRLKSK